jgi:multidrug efflux system outer membrane protein
MKKTQRNAIMALGGAAALVAGCTVGPNYREPDARMSGRFGAVDRPASTQPSPAATQPVAVVDLARWWESFEDPTLDKLVVEAIRSNLDLRLATSRVQQAREQLRFNRANLLPVLDASASYTRARTSKNASVGVESASGNTSTFAGPTETDLFQAGFDAGWEIDVFGGTRRAIEAAEYALGAQVADRRDVIVTLLSEVAQNYILLRGYQYQLEIARRNEAAQADTLRLQQQKLTAGIATDLTVAQAEALLETTRSTIPTFEANVRSSIHRLSILLDREPAALVDELATQWPIPVGPPNVPVGLPAELVRRRPDVRRAERELAAATAAIGVAESELYPRFSIAGSLGLNAAKLTNLPNRGSVFYSVGPSMSWRLFDFGQIRANVRIQNALAEQAFITSRQVTLNALEEVENAIVNYDREQSRRASLRAAVEANRRSLNLARQLNDAGVVDFLNVLTAQQALFDSEDALARSDSVVSTNLVALYKALGGGWEPAEGVESTPIGGTSSLTVTTSNGDAPVEAGSGEPAAR